MVIFRSRLRAMKTFLMHMYIHTFPCTVNTVPVIDQALWVADSEAEMKIQTVSWVVPGELLPVQGTGQKQGWHRRKLS